MDAIYINDGRTSAGEHFGNGKENLFSFMTGNGKENLFSFMTGSCCWRSELNFLMKITS